MYRISKLMFAPSLLFGPESKMPSGKKIALTYIAIVFYMIAPFIVALAAGAAAWATGGNLHEGPDSICLIFGYNIGPALYFVFELLWCALLTIPTGIYAMIGYSVYLIIKERKKQK